jgi:hypothetical protein
MKTAIVATNRSTKETGETVIFVNQKEAARILAGLEMLQKQHPRSKFIAELVREFEMIPCERFNG